MWVCPGRSTNVNAVLLLEKQHENTVPLGCQADRQASLMGSHGLSNVLLSTFIPSPGVRRMRFDLEVLIDCPRLELGRRLIPQQKNNKSPADQLHDRQFNVYC